jgi:hypothetical protein
MIKEIYNNIYKNKELFDFIFKEPFVYFYHNNLKITVEAVDILSEAINYSYNEKYEIAAEIIENKYPKIILTDQNKKISIRFCLTNDCISYVNYSSGRDFIMLPFSNLVGEGVFYTDKYIRNDI